MRRSEFREWNAATLVLSLAMTCRVGVGVKSSPAKFVRFLEFRVVRGRILLFFDSETSSWEQRDERRIESSKAK